MDRSVSLRQQPPEAACADGITPLGAQARLPLVAPAGAAGAPAALDVSSFFRDPGAFQALESHLGELFKGKGRSDCVRVWVPACATGEEAYSIAMLLAERAATLKSPPAIQVFATDVDGDAIRSAREAVYPANIEADVSPARLQQFFHKDRRGYRLRGEIRERVMFAVHDLLGDAPFASLDLVSCRNLLTHLAPHALARVLEIFHFALRPHGKLFLGSTEALDDGHPLFTDIDRVHRLYVQRPGAHTRLPLPLNRPQQARALGAPPHGSQAVPSATHALDTMPSDDAGPDDLRLQLRKSIERYQASNEALQASNEELQASNEELRSATEELETSREELQSINEELLAVNLELKSKVHDLALANSDMQSLMDSTAIATVFLDRRLCITRYTPPAIALFNLIPSDVGRPLTDLTSQIDYSELAHDAQLVLERLQPLEREVGERHGNWYLARVLPCRTPDHHIVGVVLSFVDITARKRAEEELRRTRDELEISVRLRTAELERANAALRSEVNERRAAELKVRELLAELFSAEEEERRRIARELHDTLGQHLAVLAIGLKGIENEPGHAAGVREKLGQVQRTAMLLEREVDRLAHELRPPSLDDLGLEDALRRHVQGWAEESGLEVDVHTRGLRDERFAGAVETTAYRVVQEALTNVLKHARAQRVSVIAEHVGGELRVIVEDDGSGFDAAQVRSAHGRQLGLTGMAERAALVGGRLEIESEAGKGTTVYLRVPIGPPPAPPSRKAG